jgi:DNA-binding NtrC family response regulator
MTAEILLVDDNEVQSATRQAILSRAGLTVIAVSRAEQALEMLQNQELQNSIGLVLTDHLMPGMDGPQFVKTLRGQMPRLPVLVLSGLPDAEPDYEHLDVVFRMKPLPPDQLIQLVRNLLDDPIASQPIGRTA